MQILPRATAEKGLAMKSIPIRSVLIPVVMGTLSAAAVHGQQARWDWADYLGRSDSSHYSPLTQITPANISKLEIAWTYDVGEEGLYSFCPLVVGNVAYVAAKQGALV